MVWRLFRTDQAKLAADAIFAAVVAQARDPALFLRLGVPDSVDGRFDSLVLHMFMVLRRLRAGDEPSASALQQALCDRLVDDMDRNLREMGVSDLSVGRHVRKMAEGFYGRLKAYDDALDQGGDALHAVLVRNLYGGRAGLAAISNDIVATVAGYVAASLARLHELPADEIRAARLAFAALPAAAP
jgi:cytochrome b pre-mRNA-processing protein 3